MFCIINLIFMIIFLILIIISFYNINYSFSNISNKNNLVENFNETQGIYCKNCNNLNFGQCIRCYNCGFCQNNNNSGYCMKGELNKNEKCKGMWITNDIFWRKNNLL